MADTDYEKIHCPIGKWYFKRMFLLGLLLLGFGGWFLYDGLVGYPKGAVKAVAYEAFAAGKSSTWDEYSSIEGNHFSESTLEAEQLEVVKAAHEAGGQKATWEDYARKKKIDLGEPAAGSENRGLFEAFKAGGEDEAEWETYASANDLPEDPSNMAVRDERVDALFSAFGDAEKPREWGTYAAGNDLPSKEPHFHGKNDIRDQFFVGGACVLAGLVVLALMVLNRNRSVSADGEAYYPKPSAKVPFADVFKIDTRKWRRKGLAYAYYKQGSGDEKKAVLDDLKFVGSQAILDRMLGKFEGELIEEVVDEDDENEDGTPEEQAEVVAENTDEKPS